LFENWSITSPDVALRMDYSAANQAVTFYLDADGATGGYNWVAQGTASLASGTYNLNLSPTDTFTIFLLGSSGYQNIVADQAYLSGLVITVSSAPIVTTGAATAITTTAATLNGTVNPNGLATTAKFEYGLTTAYGSSTNVALSPNNGVAAQAVSAMLTGLQAGLTYHYRLTATNGDGTALGNDATFATASLPPQLDITRAGPQFLLSWLTNCPGFVVETTSNLSVGTVWQIVTNAVTISDNRFWVTNPPVSKPAFYRLRLQISNPVPAGMALIPAGPFVMGDTFSEGERYELPLHTVYVSAFYMDMNLVSYALWQEVYNWAITNGYSFDNAGAGKAANHPAQSMTWYDAVKWCNARSEKEGRVPAYYMEVGLSVRYRTGQVNVQTNWVNWSAGYRLPTEAEWEKTARGGASGQRFPWGNTISWSQANYYIIWPGGMSYWPYDVNPTSGYNPAWTSGGQPYTTPVGSFAANGYGLYDMAGNVYQWCWDWWASGGAYPSSSQTDPRGPASGYTRVIRGGGWFDGAYACRAAYREYYSPTSSYSGMGFRSVLPPGQ
jgi:formylglycine-generating enzyme required for sulfatase activity